MKGSAQKTKMLMDEYLNIPHKLWAVIILVALILPCQSLLAQTLQQLESRHLTQLLSVNRVDGPVLALGSNEFTGLNVLPQKIQIKAAGAYSFSSQKFQGVAGLSLSPDWDALNTDLFFQVYAFTASHDRWKSAPLDNSTLVLMNANDEFNYWRRAGFEVGVQQQLGRHWSVGASSRREKWQSLNTQLRWSLFGASGAARVNPTLELNNQRLTFLHLEVGFENVTNLYGYRSGWRFMLSYDRNLSGQPTDRFEAELAAYLPTDYLAIHTRVRVGSSTEHTFPQTFSLGGRGSLPAWETNSLSGNRMLLSNTEMLLRARLIEDETFWRELALVVLFDVGIVGQVSPDIPLYKGWAFENRTSTAAGTDTWAVSGGIGLGSRNAVWLVAYVGAISGDEQGLASNRVMIRFSPNF